MSRLGSPLRVSEVTATGFSHPVLVSPDFFLRVGSRRKIREKNNLILDRVFRPGGPSGCARSPLVAGTSPDVPPKASDSVTPVVQCMDTVVAGKSSKNVEG